MIEYLDFTSININSVGGCGVSKNREIVQSVSRQEFGDNKPKVFYLENNYGEVIPVNMHPQCFVDLCLSGYSKVCVECSLRISEEFKKKEVGKKPL